VRETRVTSIVSHVFIGLSVLFIEQLKLIPRPVLDGLFLYLAITALHTNQLFERIMLLVTEQASAQSTYSIQNDTVMGNADTLEKCLQKTGVHAPGRPHGMATRGQSNLTKSASRGPIPRLWVTPGGRNLYH